MGSEERANEANQWARSLMTSWVAASEGQSVGAIEAWEAELAGACQEVPAPLLATALTRLGYTTLRLLAMKSREGVAELLQNLAVAEEAWELQFGREPDER